MSDTSGRSGLEVRGAWTALITPFTDPPRRDVDLEALTELVEFQITEGIDALVPCGTTGESPTLTHEEHDRVIVHVVRTAAGRVPVIAGTGSNSTREALRLTTHAAEVGADGALVVCPYYNRPSQRMLLDHYARLAEASSIPIIVYNVPSRTGVNLVPETIAELRTQHEHIAGLKEASGNLAQVARIRDLCDIPILSGDDGVTLPIMALGGTGVISVASNVVPREVTEYVHALLDGDLASGRGGHVRLHRLFTELFREPNPVPVKCALELAGRGNGNVRAPLLRASGETRTVLRDVLAELELIGS